MIAVPIASEVVRWLKSEEFVRCSGWEDRSDEECPFWEVAWGHTTGYGYVTFRIDFGADTGFGYGVIVLSGPDSGISLGYFKNLDHVKALYHLMKSSEYDG